MNSKQKRTISEKKSSDGRAEIVYSNLLPYTNYTLKVQSRLNHKFSINVTTLKFQTRQKGKNLPIHLVLYKTTEQHYMSVDLFRHDVFKIINVNEKILRGLSNRTCNCVDGWQNQTFVITTIEL